VAKAAGRFVVGDDVRPRGGRRATSPGREGPAGRERCQEPAAAPAGRSAPPESPARALGARRPGHAPRRQGHRRVPRGARRPETRPPRPSGVARHADPAGRSESLPRPRRGPGAGRSPRGSAVREHVAGRGPAREGQRPDGGAPSLRLGCRGDEAADDGNGHGQPSCGRRGSPSRRRGRSQPAFAPRRGTGLGKPRFRRAAW
jgi:hypothetical protein